MNFFFPALSLPLVVRRGTFCLFLAMVTAVSRGAEPMLDDLEFGDSTSEQAHGLEATQSEVGKGALDEPIRRLLPLDSDNWEGGSTSFTMKINPDQLNYLTIKLWGSDLNKNRLILFCEGKQVGYRHLGDVDLLDIPNGEAAYPGRFIYNTTPLPMGMTSGKTEIHLEIRVTGAIYGYASTFDKYQKPMEGSSRDLYRVYTHSDGCFVPPKEEKQGSLPGEMPLRPSPGEEVMADLKTHVAQAIDSTLNAHQPLSQEQMQFIARAWRVSWSSAYQNDKVVQAVMQGADAYFRNYRQNPDLAHSDPKMYNSDWIGLGPLGQAIFLLSTPLQAHLDEKIDDGTGELIPRRAAWSEMLQISRDWHLKHRRQYTNQSMITDLNMYLANRGVEAIDAAHALPEDQVRHYLYQSLSIEPWLGSDGDGGPLKPLGDDYWQLTQKGLSKELGFVGYYGEVLDWSTHIYEATCDPDKPASGDEKIKAQLAKMSKARSCFRYPLPDDDGYRAMRAETIVGWRDPDHYPGEVMYGERPGWEGSAIYSTAATLDPVSVGYAQQMFGDNQFFQSLTDQMKSGGGLRKTNSMLVVPDQYDLVKAQPASASRLPMTPGQPDFVFSDEEDGVLALKHGDDILYASLYWRARNAINFLARVHYITPLFDRIGVVHEETEFEPSGLDYFRPNWINMGFGGGGVAYPDHPDSALAGEKLPIAKVPDGIAFKAGDENPYAGRGSFYQLHYGPYLIGMNCTRDKTYPLKIPADQSGATVAELVSGQKVKLTDKIDVGPMSTVVLCFPEATANSVSAK